MSGALTNASSRGAAGMWNGPQKDRMPCRWQASLSLRPTVVFAFLIITMTLLTIPPLTCSCTVSWGWIGIKYSTDRLHKNEKSFPCFLSCPQGSLPKSRAILPRESRDRVDHSAGFVHCRAWGGTRQRQSPICCQSRCAADRLPRKVVLYYSLQPARDEHHPVDPPRRRGRGRGSDLCLLHRDRFPRQAAQSVPAGGGGGTPGDAARYRRPKLSRR